MKTLTKCLMALLLALTLCGFTLGCASGDGDSAQKTNSDTENLILLESGWSATDGYVHYGIAFENTSDALVAAFPTVVITGLDEEGNILFSESQTLEFLVPPGVGYYGSAAGNGVIPDAVEFSLTVDKENWRSDDGLTAALLTVGETEEINGVYGSTSYVGDLLTSTEWDSSCGAIVSVILRNENSEIVYGGNARVNNLAANQANGFEVVVCDAPTHSSYEIYAFQQEK